MYHENTPLANSLASLLHISSDDDWSLIDSVKSLATDHGDEVYDEFFYVLTHMRFGVETARHHWNSIIQHVASVITPRYHNQGFLPTVLHYMHRMTGTMNDPRFLEADYIGNIQRSSITDGLTALYNQTFFKITLEKMIQQSRRHSMPPFAVVLFDLDHFKEFNDSCGHLKGDHVLKRVAHIIQHNIREGDIAVRYGGEEFALLLPQATRVYATNIAQRIRRAIEAEVFTGQEHLSSGNLTISGGVAEFPLDAGSTNALIECADAELYKAKSRRNCVYPAGDDRRLCFRRQVRSLVEFAQCQESSYRSCISLDVSEFGMALGCDMPFNIGEPVNLRFCRPFWNSDFILNGTVRQTRKFGDLNFIGVEFDNVLLDGKTGQLAPFDQSLNINRNAKV